MKTMILTLMMSLVMIAPAAFSKSDSTYIPEKSNEQKFEAAVNLNHDNIVQVRMINPDKEKVQLKVYSGKSVKLYQRNLKKVNAIKLDCDMSLLKEGTYRFVIEKEGKEVLSKEIDLK